ncbi:MAG: glutamyl-tRNA reductase [Gammaproteobacteria bacterium]|nr:glutamyl-tRNA reductase [Gammaproteobacteria bacterium]
MSLLAFGINHKTAPVDIREKVAFDPQRLPDALRELVSRDSVNEAAILSTCNRTELYCETENSDEIEDVLSWFCEYHGLNLEEVRPYIYAHPDSSAVHQIMRVASGLDSLILGEPQILGQMKDAFSAANEAGTVGSLLNKLFQQTFTIAKKVRTDTAIGSSPVSVAFAAVSLAKQFFTKMETHTALLIGAGDTTELVARHLKETGIGRLIIANRTVEKARQLATELGGFAIGLNEIPQHLAEADLLISSTASQEPIVTREMAAAAMKSRKHKPILMVDIAVPRDIEASIIELEDIYLYTVDNLTSIIQEGMRSRQAAAEQAEEMIESQVVHFMGWMRSLEAVKLIRDYRQSAEQQRDEQLNKALGQLSNGKPAEDVIKELANGLTNKLIHKPTIEMNQAAYAGNNELLAAAQQLLGIENKEN